MNISWHGMIIDPFCFLYEIFAIRQRTLFVRKGKLNDEESGDTSKL